MPAAGALLLSVVVVSTLARVEEEISDARKVQSISAEIQENRSLILQMREQERLLGWIESNGDGWRVTTNRYAGQALDDFARIHDEDMRIAREGG